MRLSGAKVRDSRSTVRAQEGTSKRERKRALLKQRGRHYGMPMEKISPSPCSLVCIWRSSSPHGDGSEALAAPS